MDSNGKLRPVIVDTDMGPDDWIALLYLALSSRISLKAITIAGTGEAHGSRGMHNCEKLLKVVKQPRVPIGVGRSKPLTGKKRFPWLMRFVVDRFLFIKPPATDTATANTGKKIAVGLLADTLEAGDGKHDILAIGPLTNIADLLERRPTLISNVGHIYIMGGAVHVEGNIKNIRFCSKNSTAEWNIYCDPRAASIVFRSGIPITLIPLDATNQVYLDSSFLRELLGHSDNPICAFTRQVLLRLKARVEKNRYFLWDVSAAAILLNPSIGTYTDYPLYVIEEGAEAGRTVVDPLKGTPINVCTSLDREQFREDFFTTLTSFR